jgi:hypothetical protein
MGCFEATGRVGRSQAQRGRACASSSIRKEFGRAAESELRASGWSLRSVTTSAPPRPSATVSAASLRRPSELRATINKVVNPAVDCPARQEERSVHALYIQRLANRIELPSDRQSVLGRLSLVPIYHDAGAGRFLNEAIEPGLCEVLECLRRACAHVSQPSCGTQKCTKKAGSAKPTSSVRWALASLSLSMLMTYGLVPLLPNSVLMFSILENYIHRQRELAPAGSIVVRGTIESVIKSDFGTQQNGASHPVPPT